MTPENQAKRNWALATLIRNPRLVRNSRPVMPDESNIDATFHQTVHNPSVRDKGLPSEILKKNEDLLEDIVLQLNAAQKAAIYFENEASELHASVQRIEERYSALVNKTMQLEKENDRLKDGGFWRGVGRFFTGHGKGQFSSGE